MPASAIIIKLLPSFQNKLTDKRYRSHLRTIDMLIRKLESMGNNALKILAVEDFYVLAELKVHKPPYRMYVIYNQKTNVHYLVDWEHKSKQEEIISKISGKLMLAGKYTLDELFT